MTYSSFDIKDFYQHMPKSAFNYTVNISEQSSFIYFETAKVACSTIKKTLQDIELEISGLEPMPDVRDMHRKKESPLKSPSDAGLDHFKEFLNDESIFKFAFVRNPFSRVLSAYLDKIKKNTPEREKIVRRLGINASEDITLTQFLECIGNTPIKEMDHHWRPQSHQIFYDIVRYNFIGRFENFTHDFESVLGEVYCGQSQSRLRVKRYSPHSTQASDRVSNFYTEHTIKLVQNIYRKDFENFEYPLELPEGRGRHIDESYLNYFKKGERLLKGKDIKGAIIAFQTSIEINPSYSWAHHCLGNALFWNHQLDEAVKEYERAIKLKPDLVASYRQLGKIFTKQKETSKADKVYKISEQIEHQNQP